MNLEALNPQTRDWLWDAFGRAVDEYIDDPQEAAYAAQLTRVARDLGVGDDVLAHAGRKLAATLRAHARLGYDTVNATLPADASAAPADTLTWAREALADDIAAFYDDPACAWDIDSSGADVYRPHAYRDSLRTAASDLGVDYDQVVAERASPHERARMADILASETR